MYLDEAVSLIKRTRMKKVKALAGRSAIAICKEENPSLYAKYKRYKDLYKGLKNKIKARYSNRAMMSAKRKIKS